MAVIYQNTGGGGLFGALLPKLLGLAGGAIGGPLGAGLGSTVGGVATGQPLGQALGNGALSAGLGTLGDWADVQKMAQNVDLKPQGWGGFGSWNNPLSKSRWP